MVKILPIKIYSCPILRKKSRKLKAEELQEKKIKQFISDMEKTMLEKDGVGLAAPQVGHNLRVVVIKTEEGNLVLINPKILRKSWRKDLMEEGCLSLPEIFGLVKRPTRIKLVALDKNGKRIKFKAVGYFARVIQHEVDHLEGVLFIDKAQEIVKGKEYLNKMKKNN